VETLEPQPDREEIIAVFKELAKPYLSAEQQERSLELMLNLEKVKNIAELMDIVSILSRIER